MKNLYEYINEASVLGPTQDKVASVKKKMTDLDSFPKKNHCVKDSDGWFTYTWNLSQDGLDEYIQDETKYKKLKVSNTVKMPENALQLCFKPNPGIVFGHVIGHFQFIGHLGRYKFCFTGGGFDGEVWDKNNFKQKSYDLFCKIRDDKDIFQKWADSPHAEEEAYVAYELDLIKMLS